MMNNSKKAKLDAPSTHQVDAKSDTAIDAAEPAAPSNQASNEPQHPEHMSAKNINQILKKHGLLHVFWQQKTLEQILELVNVCREWDNAVQTIAREEANTRMTLQVRPEGSHENDRVDCWVNDPNSENDEHDKLCRDDLIHFEDIKKVLLNFKVHDKFELYETIGRVYSIDRAKLVPQFFQRMGVAFGASLQELVVYWFIDLDEKEEMSDDVDEEISAFGVHTNENTGQLVDLVAALPNLTRLTVWFNGYRVRPELIQRLANTLKSHQNLKHLDLIKFNNFLTFESFTSAHIDFSGVVERLEHFSFNIYFNGPEKVLATAGPGLTHLDIGLIYSDKLTRLVTEIAPSLGTSVTTLAMKLGNGIDIFETIAHHFVNLKTLKIDFDYESFKINHVITESLSRLPNLCELVLNGVDFTDSHPRFYPLPSVTKLTVTDKNVPSGSDHLMEDFCTEHDPDRPEVKRLDVQAFRRAMFDQFPNLKQLTLIGNVYQAELTHERLTRELGPRLEQLDMFFRDRDVPFPKVYGGPTARKSTGGPTVRTRLETKHRLANATLNDTN